MEKLKNDLQKINDEIKKLEKSIFYQSRGIAGDTSYKMDYVNKCLELPQNTENIKKYRLSKVSEALKKDFSRKHAENKKD